MLLPGVVLAELRFHQAAAPCSPGTGGWVEPMRALLSLQLAELRLGQGWLGWGAAGWSPRPLAGSMKSPGRQVQSPGRVLESFLWLPQSPGRVLKFLVKEICPRGNNKVIIYFLIS